MLTEALARIAEAEGAVAAPGERDARARGWRLAIHSNTDRDFIDASLATIGVPFDEVVVASEIGSYKPAHDHWTAFAARTGVSPAACVHVGASLFHDAEPAVELGLPMVWIDRLGETATVPVAHEQPTLTCLADALDALVPGAGEPRD